MALLFVQTLDTMFAWNLNAHVMSAFPNFIKIISPMYHLPTGGYEFLMQNCESNPPDSSVNFALT